MVVVALTSSSPSIGNIGSTSSLPTRSSSGRLCLHSPHDPTRTASSVIGTLSTEPFQGPRGVGIPIHGLVGSTVPCFHCGQHRTSRRLRPRCLPTPPKDVVRIPRWSESSDGSPVAFEIVCPSLSGEEAIVPVIVEIKTPNPGNIFDIYRALRATND